MVICNIVYGLNIDKSDFEILEKLGKCKSINVISDITFLNTDVPTIFYGYKTAIKNCGEFDRNDHQINSKYWWTYCNGEIESENWIFQFVKMCEESWFSYVDNGIDVIFDDFNLDDFINKLSSYPLIHEGEYEIYVAEFDDGVITIHSFKKETLEYSGVKPNDFLKYMYSKLDYNFLSFESKRYDLIENFHHPIFLDDVLFSIYGELFEVKDVANNFKNDFTQFFIDRPKVIVYYLKRIMSCKVNFIHFK